MEAEEGLLGKIRPPRLEDAGLEDCALPPEAIKEAFFKAASSIRSWTYDDGSVQDPKPKEEKLSDTLIGIAPTSDPGSPCRNEIGGGVPEVLGDEVAVGISDAQNEVDDGADRVVDSEVPEDGSQVGVGKKACVDGLQGIDVEDGNDEEEEEEEEEERKKEMKSPF